jgi:hypothetical protein
MNGWVTAQGSQRASLRPAVAAAVGIGFPGAGLAGPGDPEVPAAVPSSLIALPCLADWPRRRVPIVISWPTAPVPAGLLGWVHDPRELKA